MRPLPRQLFSLVQPFSDQWLTQPILPTSVLLPLLFRFLNCRFRGHTSFSFSRLRSRLVFFAPRLLLLLASVPLLAHSKPQRFPPCVVGQSFTCPCSAAAVNAHCQSTCVQGTSDLVRHASGHSSMLTTCRPSLLHAWITNILEMPPTRSHQDDEQQASSICSI